MGKEALVQELNSLVSAFLESKGLELIELIYRFDGKKIILTVLADKPQGNACLPARQALATDSQSHKAQADGLASASQSHKAQGAITLQECAIACRQIKDLLEEKNIIDTDYVLEVSSPGLDRLLKSQKDFLRVLNKEVVFFLKELVSGKCQWQGLICKVSDNSVFVQTPGEILEISLTKINKAKLVI
ncbi:MAG: hypothetical protein NT014_02795 [Candidatus Omnitrophica bacterium]|nr:hypothetical protein [Candidatus Omnitrophota bacterium]